jgi:acyl carrier protein
MAEHTEILDGLKQVINLVKKTDHDKIQENTDLMADLGFDEVARLEVLMMTERYFAVQFSDREMDELVRLKDIIASVDAQKSVERWQQSGML